MRLIAVLAFVAGFAVAVFMMLTRLRPIMPGVISLLDPRGEWRLADLESFATGYAAAARALTGDQNRQSRHRQTIIVVFIFTPL